MDRKTVTLALCLTTLMLLMGAATMATLGGTTDDSGSRGTRATPIDGSFKDEFDTTNNLTLQGDANVVDGQIIVDRTLYTDEFDRFPLAPWEVEEGNPRISQGVLLTNGSESSGARASKSIDLHDMEIRLDFSPGIMMIGGPIINLSGPGEDTLIARYNHNEREIQLWLNNTTGDHELTSSSAQLVQDEWYRAQVVIEGSSIMFEMGPGILIADRVIQGNFDKLTLGTGNMDSAAWDNVTISKLGGSGEALTDKVKLPVDTFWTSLNLVNNKPVGTTLRIALIDPSTGQPYTDLNDIT
ncbi:MAG: hypothetical protein GWN18_04455, partial [Thermoplasmata archaeon]|nr:hypothetical protein [Thermoplasmata archaeon]NIS11110.1 hypothetical protein [Thermoplasmata archaeon]NIS19224.1 hypothetical protein [Thermoplasmata archaeon]NIT76289.1 hypothetical protein [Thermoplasmata archaeon]NIU48356.1 hypothetical protein [Thermoplasmata archaeon]